MVHNKTPLVSIIIPTHKRPDMLDRAIRSVLNQTYNNIEIVVVDDNGAISKYRKETENCMKKYKDNKKIKYIKNEKNLGGAEARNVGIYFANGELISFLDDDDEYDPKKIEEQVLLMFSSDINNLAFVYCQMSMYNQDNNLVGVTKNYFRGNKEPFFNNLIRCIAGTPTILVKKSVLIDVGGFKNIKSGQDWYLIIQILEKGYNVDYSRKSLVKVHLHEGERISNTMNKVESLNNEIYEIKLKYMKSYTEKQKNIVLYEHNMQLANHIKLFNKKESIRYFLKALSFKKLSKRNIIFIGTLLLPYKYVMKIKRYLGSVKQ